MRNVIKRIGTATIMILLFVCGYSLGVTQRRVIKEDKTNKAAVEKVRDSVDVILDSCKYNIAYDNIVDMQKVIGFDVTEYGLMIYFGDGTGYYFER